MLPNVGRDLDARRVTGGIVVAIPVETNAVVTVPGDDMKLPVSDTVVSLACEIIFGDVRDAIGAPRVDYRLSDPLREMHGGCSDVRRQVGQALDVDARYDDDVKAIDRPLADDRLNEPIGEDRHRGIIETTEWARRIGYRHGVGLRTARVQQQCSESLR
jgi:hypothetical protein